MANNIILLIMTALPLLGSPGPATLSVAAAGSVYDFRPSLPYMLGIVCGTSTVVLLVASGVTGLVLTLPGAVPILSVAALAYILFLAYKIATAPVLSEDVAIGSALSLYGGFLLAIANPKAFAAIGAVYAGVTVAAENSMLYAAIKIAVLFGLVAAVNTAWLALGAFLSRHLRHPRTGRAINILFAVLLVASVAMVAVT